MNDYEQSNMKRKDKQTRLKQYHIEDKFLRTALTILVGSKEAFQKYCDNCKELSDLTIGGQGKHIWHYEKRWSIMWVSKPSIEIITHELIHHTFSAFNDRRIPILFENDETMAYYIEMMLIDIKKKIKLIK